MIEIIFIYYLLSSFLWLTVEKKFIYLHAVSTEGTNNPVDAKRIKKESIQRCIQSLVHACRCKDEDCHLPSCAKMKKVVQHTRTCKKKKNGGCPICKQLIALCCYHSKHCDDDQCPVPFCPSIKQRYIIFHFLLTCPPDWKKSSSSSYFFHVYIFLLL